MNDELGQRLLLTMTYGGGMLMGKLTDHWWTVLIGMAGFYFGCKLFGWLAKAKS